MADDRIVIELELDDGKIIKAFQRVGDSAKKAGSEAGTQLEQGLGKSLSSLTLRLGAVATAAAAVGAAFALKKGIDEAAQFQQSVQNLNQSLANAGRFSQEASQSFQSLAQQISNTTTLSDDQVLSAATLANNYARTTQQAQALTKAAIELSAATGKDLNTSVQILGKTLNGSAGQLGQNIAGIKALTAEQLKAGAAIDLVAQRFEGTAAGQAKTFNGAIQQATNSFNDLFKAIGQSIVQSPTLINFINLISIGFQKAGDAISAFTKGSDPFASIIVGLQTIAQTINDALIVPLELVFNAMKLIGQTVVTAIVTPFTSGISLLLEPLIALGSVLDRVLGTGFSQSLLSAQETLNNITATLKEETVTSFQNLDNLNFANSVTTGINQIGETLLTVNPLVAEFKNNISPDADGTVSAQLFTLSETFGFVAQGIATEAQNIANSIRTNMQSAGKAMFQTLGQGAGQAFAAFGRAVATGQNAMTAFLNSLLASFGQAAIQLGTNFILQGIAYTYAQLPNGPPLIAAGAALAAFGGILSGLGGGSGGTQAAGAGGATAVTPIGGDAGAIAGSDIDPNEQLERGQNVVVNLDGVVTDPVAAATQIAQLLSEVTDSNAISVRSA